MLTKIKRQFIKLYGESQDGFLIVNGKTALFANAVATKMLSGDETNSSIVSLFGTAVTNKILQCAQNHEATNIENELIGDKLFDIKILPLDGDAIVVLHEKNDFDKYRKDVEFYAKSISAICRYQRDHLNNVHIALGAMKENNTQYLKIIGAATDSAIKSNTAVCEISENISGKSDRISANNLVALLKSVATCTNSTLAEKEIEVVFNTTVEREIAFYESIALERAIYSVISALVRIVTRKSRIDLSYLLVNQQTFVKLKCSMASITKEYMDFIYRRRIDSLDEDVFRYGYDMLRANVLMEWQNGELLIDNKDNGVEIMLALPHEKSKRENAVMHSETEMFGGMREACITFSDILSDEIK